MWLIFLKTLSMQGSSLSKSRLATGDRWKWLNLQGWWTLSRRGDKATIQGIPSAQTISLFMAYTLVQLLGTWTSEGSHMSPFLETLIGPQGISSPKVGLSLRFGLGSMTGWVPCLNFVQLWGAIPAPKNPIRIGCGFSGNHLVSMFHLPHPLWDCLWRFLPTKHSICNSPFQS